VAPSHVCERQRKHDKQLKESRSARAVGAGSSRCGFSTPSLPPTARELDVPGEDARALGDNAITCEPDTRRMEATAVLTAHDPEVGQTWGSALEARGADVRAGEEELRRGRLELSARERQLAGREQQLAARERELASREAEVHAEFRCREQHAAGQEQRFVEREEQLLVRSQRLADREELLMGREQRLAEREADFAKQWQELRASRDEVESRVAEAEATAARLRLEEERVREYRKQLDERGQRWDEACKEAHVIRQCNPRPRLSPRLGKENQELQRQLEEQQGRIHDIKRRPESWGSDSDSTSRRDSLG